MLGTAVALLVVLGLTMQSMTWPRPRDADEASRREDSRPCVQDDVTRLSEDIPNRTKVVRLIVVPANLDPLDAKAVSEFAMQQRAAATDVFIVKLGGTWHPMSWLGGALIEHDKATSTTAATTVFAMVTEREQIQWESTVPFRVVSIQKKESIPASGVMLINRPDPPGTCDSPADPFKGRWKRDTLSLQPVRSGPPSLNNGRWYNQRYKVDFEMELEGKTVRIDPDIFCDWS